jgi:transcriptional regulator with XRE-family HTH domain
LEEKGSERVPSRGRPSRPKKERPVDPVAQAQGARLKLLHAEKEREAGRDITQGEIAQAVGITTEAYGSYERGRIRIPYDCLVPLSRYYGVSVMYLLGLPEERLVSDKARLTAEYVNQMSDGAQSLMVTVAADQLKLDRQTRQTKVERVHAG